ncbi:mannose-ethanolamine phosphotransferase gpi13 [Serendipita sp. 411]|nr:mannose-ethanolamine phosphotransferase gpi13 [Serendipita sp. 411]
MFYEVKRYIQEPTRTATLLLCWLFVLRFSGLYLFTRGFLLSRLSLSNVNDCSTCTLTPTHKRAVFLIIDALRFDFISPNPPLPFNDAHHHVLTLPQELSAKYPQHSFIFNAHSDPPTATMQRIKGVTTGSLPTFIDVSANFGATSIEEDSLLLRLNTAGKKIAFMGDDTWMSLYGDLVDPSARFPYDSFNVEDLHSVDNGVIEHLFPLLNQKEKTWDFLIGHFLGVDHAGHRVGPSHVTMKAKLLQMDRVLRDVVEALDEDTLLVVIGDHGMDTKGDHGGDDPWETSSSTWIYSKSVPLQEIPSEALPTSLLPNTTFPFAPTSHRGIQQIDLVPTISLLLGLPIPFNNLGLIIPELFSRGDELERALRTNVLQIIDYLQTYRSSSSGVDLDGSWGKLSLERDAALKSREDFLQKAHSYARTALEVCRDMWAQFSMTLIVLGLLVMLSTVPATMIFSQHLETYDDQWMLDSLASSFIAFAVGGTLIYTMAFLFKERISISPYQLALFSASFNGSIVLAFRARITRIRIALTPSISLLLLQAIILFSNSFVFWEERVLPFLLPTSIVSMAFSLLSATNQKVQRRGLLYGAGFLLCVRLMSLSTVCREEQGSYCHVTFYSSSTLPSPALSVLATIIPVALTLPTLVRHFMKIAAADRGLAPTTIEVYFRAALLGGTAFWFLDWTENHQTVVSMEKTYLGETGIRTIRTVIARIVAWSMGVGLALWSSSPLNLAIQKQTDSTGHLSIQVIGFANSFGSFYLSFLCIIFSVIWLSSQLSGQVVLALGLAALLSYLEFVDSVRDARHPAQPRHYRLPTLEEVLPLALLGLETFYATGHQATLNSLQWKSAFIFNAERGILSPITVILNTLGPVIFFAMCIPLIALWAIEPFSATSPLKNRRREVVSGALKSLLLLSNYHAVLLVAAATCAMIQRRHLMVWKVFAPRFMLAGLCSIAVDVAGIAAMFGGVTTVVYRVSSTFQGVGQ